MITINTYILFSIIGITILSMFINIYVTIKLFSFFRDGAYADQERDIEELEVDNLYLKEEIKELNVYKLNQDALNISRKVDQALGCYQSVDMDINSDNLDPTVGVEILASEKRDKD